MPATNSIIDAVAAPAAGADRRVACRAEHRAVFIGTYRRTTIAVGESVAEARFEDPDWVERWDVAFAELFLAAHEADRSGGVVPRPWRLAFDAPGDLPALRLVLLGINAHVNYDLHRRCWRSSRTGLHDPVLMDRRRRDHERIDRVLASRVSAKRRASLEPLGQEPARHGPDAAEPAGSKRFLRESRMKVWHNTMALQGARLVGRDAYAARLARRGALGGEDRRPAGAWSGPAPARGRRVRRDLAAPLTTPPATR